MKKIYILNGTPESGKTTLGKIVDTILRERGINFKHASSIDPVKRLLRPKEFWDQSLIEGGLEYTLANLKSEVTTVDWDGVTKDAHWRGVMSDLKLKITQHSPNLIHHLVLNEFKHFTGDFVGFVDIRESDSIEAFIKHASEYSTGIEVYKLCVVSDSSREFLNKSDMDVNKTRYDIIFENPRKNFVSDDISLWFLRARAMAFVEDEILEKRGKERFY